MLPPWEIWHITFQFQIKFSQFCADFWLRLAWNFIQKYLIEKYETQHFYSKSNFLNFVLILAEISMKSYSDDTSFRNKTHNTSIPNHIFSILCLLLAEITMKFHSKDTSLRNMTHNMSFPNQNFSILWLFLAEISMKFHSDDTSLRNMTHNTSIPNKNFLNFVLILGWNKYEIALKNDPLVK